MPDKVQTWKQAMYFTAAQFLTTSNMLSSGQPDFFLHHVHTKHILISGPLESQSLGFKSWLFFLLIVALASYLAP